MKHYRVVCALVIAGNRVLCMRKGETRYAYTSHRWEFPGGKIEPNETPQQALHRELLEEMDFDVVVGKELTTIHHHYPDFEITMTAFLCTSSSTNFRLKEHTESIWATKETMASLNWCEADIPIMKEVIKHL